MGDSNQHLIIITKFLSVVRTQCNRLNATDTNRLMQWSLLFVCFGCCISCTCCIILLYPLCLLRTFLVYSVC